MHSLSPQPDDQLSRRRKKLFPPSGQAPPPFFFTFKHLFSDRGEECSRKRNVCSQSPPQLGRVSIAFFLNVPSPPVVGHLCFLHTVPTGPSLLSPLQPSMEYSRTNFIRNLQCSPINFGNHPRAPARKIGLSLPTGTARTLFFPNDFPFRRGADW